MSKRDAIIAVIKALHLEREGISRQKLKTRLALTPTDLNREIKKGVEEGIWTQPKGRSGKIFLRTASPHRATKKTPVRK